MPSVTSYKDLKNERAMLKSLSADVPWDVVNKFSKIVRDSGSPEERGAFEYLAGYLKKWGVPHKIHEPQLFLSLPRHASVTAGGKTYRAKTLSMSASTGAKGLTAEVVYVPAKYATGPGSLFSVGAEANVDVRGKIVLTEGLGMPMSASYFESKGAVGLLNINPGVDIHWAICTTIWGTPDLDSYGRKPKIPVASVNNPDGQDIKKLAEAGGLTVTLVTELEEGWKKGTILVAEIPGTEEPEKFLLAHGHLDSWDVGVGDNATGNAALLELARVFWQHRDQLKRSLRVAWWTGHSHGRYAGSTWYADNFGVDLFENCLAQVNIDSPGCRFATEYRDISWFSEAEQFCQTAIKDAVGKPSSGSRAHQAGDYSFNNIGITSFYMLLSTMPEAVAKEQGNYAVGGCGGNIAWHTENDQLEVADKDILMNDLKVYVVSLSRVLNAPVLPFDFGALTNEFIGTLEHYQQSGAGRFDLTPSLREARGLKSDLSDFYRRAKVAKNGQASAYNTTILRLARLLVPINYTREGAFRHDPAVNVPPLPDLAPIEQLCNFPPGSDLAGFAHAHLVRGQNRLVTILRQARELVQSTGIAPSPRKVSKQVSRKSNKSQSRKSK
jgi:N-acetylated-alpha-linked acidic dipeptidase